MERWIRCPTRRRVAQGIAAVLLGALVLPAGAAPAVTVDRAASTAAGALPAVVAAVQAARRGEAIPARLTPPIARIKLFPQQYRIPPPCFGHDSNSAKVESRVCRVGRPSSKKVMVLFGDSHAFMWLPAVLETARRDGWTLVPLIRFGCTPRLWFLSAGADACRAWFRWSLRQIGQLHPDVTLLGGSIGERPSAETRAATEGVIAAARTLKSLGRTVVIGDPEGLENDPVPCLLARGSLSSCGMAWPRNALAGYDTVARATRRLGVGFVPTRGFVCFQRHCPAVVGHTIVWMDNSHLTGYYSAQLAEPFRDRLLAAVR